MGDEMDREREGVKREEKKLKNRIRMFTLRSD
jgi:hypothetical protein